MADYTKLLENEIQEIAGRYKLKAFSYRPIEQGAGNSNYLLDTNHGKHILTIFEIEPSRVAHISKALLLLEKHEFPAPRLQKLAKGGVLTKFQDKSVLVKPYISGYVDADMDDEKTKQVGAAMAKLHELPPPDYLPDSHSYTEITYPAFMEKATDQYYKTWVRQRFRYFIEKLPSQLPVGLVHGDIFYDNVLFEDENFKAILDFEDVCRIYKIYDLGMAVVGICAKGTKIDLKKARALIHGYQEIRNLEETERDSLQICIEWAAISTSIWRYCRHNIDMPNPNNSEKYMQMVHIAKSAKKIPGEEFKMEVFS